jgi:hypothetical protein
MDTNDNDQGMKQVREAKKDSRVTSGKMESVFVQSRSSGSAGGGAEKPRLGTT